MKQVFLIALVIAITATANAQPSVDIIKYINAYKDLAMDEMQRTGVPAAIKLAQGIHETSAGTSHLVVKSNNHFGIKCKSNWTGKKVYHDDDERGECFRSYVSSEDSYRDHSDFLRNAPRYGFLFTKDPTDYEGWAYGLKQAGYATNIRYSQILIRLIEQYNLQQYTLLALNRIPEENEALVKVPTPSSTNPIDPAVSPKDVLPEAEYAPAVNYPNGEFVINRTRVIFSKKGSSLLAIAEEYGINYARLLDFNDMKDADVLGKSQLLFLQRKRKSGSNEFHVVQQGEKLYDICQAEGIRLESLIAYNLLQPGMEPAPGEKVYLQSQAPARPLLLSEIAVAADEPATEAVLSESSRHIVKMKETLYSISKLYGVDMNKIRQWNQLEGFDLKIGQELVIFKN